MKKKLNIDSFKILLMYIMVIGMLSFAEQKMLFNIVEYSFVAVFGISYLKSRIRFTSYLCWAVIFFSWCLSSLLWAKDIDTSYVALRMLLQVLIIGILITSYAIDKGLTTSEHLINAVIIGAFVLACRLIIATPGNDWGTIRIGTSLGYNQNSLGLSMSFACICAIYKIKKCKERKLQIAILFLLIIIFVFIALMTGSRKAFFLIIAGSSIYILISTKKRRRIFIILPIVIGLVMCFYMLVLASPKLYNVLGSRIEDTLDVFSGRKSGEDTMVRIYMIIDAYEWFLKKPILGYGIENYRVVGQSKLYAHNNYLELLTGVGIVGCTIYYSLLIKIQCSLFYSWIKYRKNCELEMTLLICILVMDLAMVSYYDEKTQFILTLIYAKYYLLKNDKINFRLMD